MEGPDGGPDGRGSRGRPPFKVADSTRGELPRCGPRRRPHACPQTRHGCVRPIRPLFFATDEKPFAADEEIFAAPLILALCLILPSVTLSVDPEPVSTRSQLQQP